MPLWVACRPRISILALNIAGDRAQRLSSQSQNKNLTPDLSDGLTYIPWRCGESHDDPPRGTPGASSRLTDGFTYLPWRCGESHDDPPRGTPGGALTVMLRAAVLDEPCLGDYH